MIRAIIIDDEADSRAVLETIISENLKDVGIVASVGSLPAGVIEIRRKKPDLVFLDIEMPEFSGLQITDFFSSDEFQFEIIFTTAYAEYAAVAFELSALDYLLKPLTGEKVKNALEKYTRRKVLPLGQRIETLKATLENKTPDRIAIATVDRYIMIDPNNIKYIEADGAYTRVALTDGNKIMASKNLSDMTALLEPFPWFFRSHRSILVNTRHIKEVVKKDGGYIVMTDGYEALLSNSRRADLFKHMNLR